jgi:hypothetical protein
MVKKKQHGGKREGAGRPVGPDGPTMTIAATVPKRLVEALDAHAEQQGVEPLGSRYAGYPGSTWEP